MASMPSGDGWADLMCLEDNVPIREHIMLLCYSPFARGKRQLIFLQKM
jgi:hypothetical protein